MAQLETLTAPTEESRFTSEADIWEARDPPEDVPPAFYRDADEPPPNDPHWREWPNGGNREPVPRFMLIGLPIFLFAFGVLHILAIMLVCHLGGLY